MAAVTWLPEFNVVIFALLLNFPWELLQVPLFARMADTPHWQGIKACTRASFGDAMILLVAYWVVAVRAADRDWIAAPRVAQIALFVAVGATVTIGIEWLALNDMWIHSWRYSRSMPVFPGIGVGLSPLLQWIVLPLLVVWFARRQLAAPQD
jgi:hypothetical protein